MKKVLFLFLIFGGLLFTLPSYAATHYIDFDSGSDSANCKSTSSPCQTFSAPDFGDIAAGDIVNVTGTYDNSLGTDITIAWTGTEESPITIQAWEGQGTPVLDGSTGFTTFTISFTGGHIILDGFNIYPPFSDSKFGVYVNAAENVTISNCFIEGDTSDTTHAFGIFYAMSNNGKILNNMISDVTGNLSLASASLIINGNYFFLDSASGSGFAISNSCGGVLVMNNHFYNYSLTYALSIHITAQDTTIINNTFYNNAVHVDAGSGVSMAEDMGTDNVFMNNIIYGTDAGQYGIIDSSSGNAFLNNLTSDNNIFYMGASDYYVEGYTSLADWQNDALALDGNSLDSDPVLSSITSGSEDLHLTNSSPAIDAGADVSAYSAIYLISDIDKETRPYNSSYDIGADERPVPDPPTSLTASNITDTTMDVSWTAPSGAITNYHLQYDTDENFTSPITTDALTEVSTSLSGLDPDTTYYFRAYDTFTSSYQSYQSAYSASLTATTDPSMPTDIIVSDINPKTASISWTDLNNTATYTLEHSENSDFSGSTSVASISSNPYALEGLKTSKKNYIRLKAVNVSDESDYSSPESFRTLPQKGKVLEVAKKEKKLIFKCRKMPRIKQAQLKIYKYKKKTKKYKIYKTKKKKSGLTKNKIKFKVLKNNLKKGKYKVKVRGKWKKKKGPWSEKKKFCKKK
ncbi:MAG: fibronectin type III domain-containing protein [Patescibacteria group bacterium]